MRRLGLGKSKEIAPGHTAGERELSPCFSNTCPLIGARDVFLISQLFRSECGSGKKRKRRDGVLGRARSPPRSAGT